MCAFSINFAWLYLQFLMKFLVPKIYCSDRCLDDGTVFKTWHCDLIFWFLCTIYTSSCLFLDVISVTLCIVLYFKLWVAPSIHSYIVFIFLKTLQLYWWDGWLTLTCVVNNRFSNCAKLKLMKNNRWGDDILHPITVTEEAFKIF